MANLAVLGIDVGTTVVKAALFERDGQVTAVAGRQLGLAHPAAGHVEQDVEEILARVEDVVAEAVAAFGPPAVVGVTGQGDGCWLVDAAGRPVRPAISWLDGRAADRLARWERDGVAETVFRTNGNALFPGAMAPILSWLDEHEPEALDRAETAASCKDVVFQQLTGVRATESSVASRPFGNGTGDGYSEKLIAAAGLGHRRELLAPIVRPLPAAPLRDRFARVLPAGTTVVSSPFDMAACAAGGGVTEPGDGLLIIGTTLACEVMTDRLMADGDPVGMHVALPAPERWLRAMAAMSGTACLDWVLDTVGMRHEELEHALAHSPPGASGVAMLPYLAPSGERAPFLDPAANGQFTGLRLTSSRADLVRATCEGLAYVARDCFDAAGLTGRVVVCGGGTRSRAWLEIFASVLGRPLHVARTPEVGARGAALSALSLVDLPFDPEKWTAAESVIDPIPALRPLYDAGYHSYRAHRDSARAQWC